MTLYRLTVHAVLGYLIVAIWVNAPLQRWRIRSTSPPFSRYAAYLVIDAGMLKVFIPRLSCRWWPTVPYLAPMQSRSPCHMVPKDPYLTVALGLAHWCSNIITFLLFAFLLSYSLSLSLVITYALRLRELLGCGGSRLPFFCLLTCGQLTNIWYVASLCGMGEKIYALLTLVTDM